MYDPLGLTASFIMQLKIKLRELVLLNLDWDKPIPEQENDWWQKKTEEIIRSLPICFMRSIWVKEAKGFLGRVQCGFRLSCLCDVADL